MSNLILPRAVKRAMYTADGLQTFDAATIDSTGAFLIGELERLDQRIHEPLVDIKWSRDIDLRSDVSIADESSSFTLSSFASVGGPRPTGKSFIGKDATTIQSMALDIKKLTNPLYLWGEMVSYSIPELESAMKLGRPVDSQKLTGLNLKHQMDVDEMVYIGDSDLGAKGLVNNDASVQHDLVAANAGNTSTLWIHKTPDEILANVNELLASVWEASAWAIVPSRLLLPPAQFAYINSQKVSTAGNMSILKFLKENSLCLAENGKELEILSSKWCKGRGEVVESVNSDRMVAYTKREDLVRFPLVPLQRTPVQYFGIFHQFVMFGRLGVTEFVRPVTLGYRDGI